MRFIEEVPLNFPSQNSTNISKCLNLGIERCAVCRVLALHVTDSSPMSPPKVISGCRDKSICGALVGLANPHSNVCLKFYSIHVFWLIHKFLNWDHILQVNHRVVRNLWKRHCICFANDLSGCLLDTLCGLGPPGLLLTSLKWKGRGWLNSLVGRVFALQNCQSMSSPQHLIWCIPYGSPAPSINQYYFSVQSQENTWALPCMPPPPNQKKFKVL